MKRLALLLALSFAAAPAHALCAMPEIGDAFLKTDNTGAALVATRLGVKPDAALDKLTFTVDGKQGTFDKVDLAPGLVAYRLPAGAKEGSIQSGTNIAKVVALDPTTPLLAAPTMSKLLVETRMGVRGSSVTATVTLTTAAPDDAVALVVVDAKGNALTWGNALRGSKEQVVLSRGRCGMLPNKTAAPMNGQSVKVFWVDVNGRVSPASKAIKAVAKTTRS